VELLQAERRRAQRPVFSLRVLRSAEHGPQPIQARREALRESEVHRGAAKVYMPISTWVHLRTIVPGSVSGGIARVLTG
jgi:hypothetical protein